MKRRNFLQFVVGGGVVISLGTADILLASDVNVKTKDQILEDEYRKILLTFLQSPPTIDSAKPVAEFIIANITKMVLIIQGFKALRDYNKEHLLTLLSVSGVPCTRFVGPITTMKKQNKIDPKLLDHNEKILPLSLY